ncbi:hypothetical protein GGF31_007443 [Allomyces arbusculus]|nr:hypothetical protein GGF31_007443 [Allomyces arbusculus]
MALAAALSLVADFGLILTSSLTMPKPTRWTFKFNVSPITNESRLTRRVHRVENLQACSMRLFTPVFGRQADMGHAPPPTSAGSVEPTEPAIHSPQVPVTVQQAQEPNKPDHDHPRLQIATPPPRFDPTALAPVQRELYHLQTIQHRARAKYATKHAVLTRALRMAEGKLERARDWVGQLPRLFSVAGADDIEDEESEFALRRRVRALAQHAAITRARVVRLRASYQDHMQQWIAREELLRRLLREVPGADAQLHWGE